jgi:gp16 family phage-associated protein
MHFFMEILPMAKAAKTPEEVKADLRMQGRTLKQFAEEKGYDATQVYRVLNGTIKGFRGRGHEIAVALGIKTTH